MATHAPGARLALRPVLDRRVPDGSWWPENRRLSEQLGQLFALWPPGAGRILRVLYSPTDWDDHPDSVAVPGGTIRLGAFPHVHPHQLLLSMRGGLRRSIAVIPADTPTRDAERLLEGVIGRAGPRESRWADQPEWDNEGGHFWPSRSEEQATIPAEVPMPHVITYRGPPVLVGALAHLLREEGVEFKQPREDRTELAGAVVVVLTVTAGDNAPDRTLSANVDAAISRFKKRFGEDSASVEVTNSDVHG